MRTRIQDKRLLLVPAGFALLAVLLSVSTWRMFDGPVPIAPHSYRFNVEVPQASNVQAGAAVRSAGVDIGEVVDVGRSDHGARLEIELEPAYAPVHVDAPLTIRSKSLLGEAYVQMGLGSGAAATVPDGGELDPRRVVPTERLDDVLEAFNPRARQNLRRAIDGFSRAVSGRAGDLSDAVGTSRPVVHSLAELAELADHQREDIRMLILEGGAVLQEVGNDAGSTEALIAAADDLFAVTAVRDRDLSSIVALLPAFLSQVTETGHAITAATPELRAAVTAVEPAAPHLEPALKSTVRALPEARRLLDDLPATLRAGGRGVPSLERLLADLGPALSDLYPVLREIVPVIQFVAEDPNVLTSTGANLSSIGNAYVPGPGGTKQRYARAVPMLWNELVAGFEEALPTSRQNQYPRPGSLERVGKEPMRAWSCNHLDNEQTIPVIPPGTGAPPCREQGAYEFNGKKAYYPRLERAAP